jgi:DNA-binding PadR family transcriptional regulator
MFYKRSHTRGDRRFARHGAAWDDVGASRRNGSGRGDGRADRHGGRGGRSGRLFDHGELRFVLLRLIEEKPRHGYELIKAIEDRAGGAYSPSPGVIYPTLTMLEELGHAVVTEEAGKKRYALTGEGHAFLRDNRRAVDAAMARMDAAAAAQGDGPAPPIVRAMENLRLALRLRLARGALSETRVRGVAAALDAAAIAIEQT